MTGARPRQHAMNYISRDLFFRATLALSRAPGTHLMVTHSSLDHRGQTLGLLPDTSSVMDTGAFVQWVGGKATVGGRVSRGNVLSLC